MAAPPPSSTSASSGRFCSSFFGLPAEAPAEDIEYLLGDVIHALSRVDSKRGVLQERIAAASRGKPHRASRRRRPHAADDAGVALLPLLPPPGDDHDDDGHGALYTRKGAAGVIRRRLRDAAGGAKKEKKRLEAVCGDLERDGLRLKDNPVVMLPNLPTA